MVVWDKPTKINTFYAEEFAYLLKRLKETPVAGGGTLLDQALVVWGMEIDNGNSHDHFDMPFVLAGGGAGKLNRGTVVDYPRSINFGGTQYTNPAGLRYHARPAADDRQDPERAAQRDRPGAVRHHAPRPADPDIAVQR